MSIRCGRVTLEKAGMYLVMLTARLPAICPALETTLTMRLNGLPVAGGDLNVSCATSGDTATQVLIQVEAGMTFSVTSSAALNVMPDVALGTLMTLTLVKVS